MCSQLTYRVHISTCSLTSHHTSIPQLSCMRISMKSHLHTPLHYFFFSPGKRHSFAALCSLHYKTDYNPQSITKVNINHNALCSLRMCADSSLQDKNHSNYIALIMNSTATIHAIRTNNKDNGTENMIGKNNLLMAELIGK